MGGFCGVPPGHFDAAGFAGHGEANAGSGLWDLGFGGEGWDSGFRVRVEKMKPPPHSNSAASELGCRISGLWPQGFRVLRSGLSGLTASVP